MRSNHSESHQLQHLLFSWFLDCQGPDGGHHEVFVARLDARDFPDEMDGQLPAAWALALAHPAVCWSPR